MSSRIPVRQSQQSQVTANQCPQVSADSQPQPSSPPLLTQQKPQTYQEKLLAFRQKKLQDISKIKNETEGPKTPLINDRSKLLASKREDADKPVYDRLTNESKKIMENTSNKQKEQEKDQMKECTFIPQITEQGKEFKRDVGLLESFAKMKEEADKRRKTKMDQKQLRIDEEMKKPIERAARQRSDLLASRSKYAAIKKPEDRLFAEQADALQKYADDTRQNEIIKEMQDNEAKNNTFKPSICERSQLLASKHEKDVKGDIFEQLYRSGTQPIKDLNLTKTDTAQAPQNLAASSQVQSANRELNIMRRYEESLDRKAVQLAIQEEEDRERRKFKMTKSSQKYLEKREDELAQTGTYTQYRKYYQPDENTAPMIDQNSENMVKNKRSGPVEERLYKLAEVLKQKQKEAETQSRANQLEKCTFQPIIKDTIPVNSTFEERTEKMIQKRQNLINQLKAEKKDEMAECTFTPQINPDSEIEQFRDITNKSSLLQQAAKSSELEVKATLRHLNNMQKQRDIKQQQEDQDNREIKWSIEPTVQKPFKASYVQQNASFLKNDMTDADYDFLDEFDIAMADGMKAANGEVVNSPTKAEVKPVVSAVGKSQKLDKSQVIEKIDKQFTQWNKMVDGIKYQQSDTADYKAEREEREYYEKAGVL